MVLRSCETKLYYTLHLPLHVPSLLGLLSNLIDETTGKTNRSFDSTLSTRLTCWSADAGVSLHACVGNSAVA